MKRHMSHLGKFMTKSEHDLECAPGNHVDNVEDDLAGHMGQGPGQPLAQDEVEEDVYHDAVSCVSSPGIVTP